MMQKLAPSLFVRELQVYKAGKQVFQASFHRGVNIIRGENGSGKSTVMNMLFYVLGGEYTQWTEDAKSCDDVYAEVETFGAVFTLRRKIAVYPPPIDIFWGPLPEALASAIGWEEYGGRRTATKESFSQLMFRAIGFPEVKTEDESNITMHQVLRLLFIDQATNFTSLMIDEKFDPPLTRKATGDLLLGIYDNELYSAQINRSRLQKELADYTSEHRGLLSVMKVAGQSTTISELEIQLQELLQEVDSINAQVAADSTTLKVKKIDTNVAELNKTLSDAKNALGSSLQELEKIVLDVQDSEDFIASLKHRVSALNESIETRRILGQLPITQCPHCLEALVRDQQPENNCILCDQPLPPEAKQTQAMRMRQELELQLKESTGLLVDKISRKELLENAIPNLRSNARLLQRNYDAFINKSQSSRDEQIDKLLIRKGNLQAQRQFLEQQINVMKLLDAARRKIEDAKRQIAELDDIIQLKHEKQRRNSSIALNSISRFAVSLLKQDGHYEAGFANASRVEVDFSKNTFAVDGRNNFSASSVVYAKNCALFGIFFASLENPFFRYPRLVMCDNMEDKGMQPERSKRFQRSVVSLSEQFDVEHQIIFSTSMIDESLNVDKYCIGEFYGPENKTLKLKSA
ncbi:ATP-binding protein [Hymenobacter negativus]|uniref:AAA family ATPase n=1 Tax=Hymenobacter negativus TaxID=2795026 RepID=A0ABS0Q6M9_9BACT|nr:ATP-binding protein [Hymenobacter negativus]MBH8557906.1 AAA family ATPase [Hymenobacter negativus]